MARVAGTADIGKRLGIVVPSVNTVVDPWYCRAVPEGVNVFVDRMMLGDKVSADSLIRMDHDEGMPALKRLATCRPHALAYGCTASSIVQGWEYDAKLRQEITAQTGLPATTACEAIRQALLAVGAKRIVIVSPYVDEIDHREVVFFEQAGFEVIGSDNFGINNTFELAAPTAAEIKDLARGAWNPEADALLISCLNMRSHLVIDELEKELGKPVVTSTQATLWHLMRLGGANDTLPGYGKLMTLPLTPIPGERIGA